MDGALRIIDQDAILAGAHHALDLHQWLTAPDLDQEGAVQHAEQVLAAVADRTARLARWQQPHRRRRAAGPRRPCAIRTHHRLFRVLVPLTGDRAPWQRGAWLPAFLGALAHEAEDGLDLLVSMERV